MIFRAPSISPYVEGRRKSAVAAISTQFKFHETVKPRQWWIDTFCAHGRGLHSSTSHLILSHPELSHPCH
jgi:hypothetical protein